MLHEPAVEVGKDPSFAYKRRLGVILFLVYAFIYAIFTAINVIAPRLMEAAILGGQNLAVVYGFGLIVVALVMALFYNAACTGMERKLAEGGKK